MHAHLSPYLSPSRRTAQSGYRRKRPIAGTLRGVSDGTRTRGRRDHNPGPPAHGGSVSPVAPDAVGDSASPAGVAVAVGAERAAIGAADSERGVAVAGVGRSSRRAWEPHAPSVTGSSTAARTEIAVRRRRPLRRGRRAARDDARSAGVSCARARDGRMVAPWRRSRPRAAVVLAAGRAGGRSASAGRTSGARGSSGVWSMHRVAAHAQSSPPARTSDRAGVALAVRGAGGRLAGR